MNVTAQDLLAKQREVSEYQVKQASAFAQIDRAENAVVVAKRAYDDARWRAEEAARELKELEAAISEEFPVV